jgi:hypothetical protein
MRFLPLPPLYRSLMLALLALATGLSRLAAQGGPPMITDDPGTPGPGKWEINLGWTDQRTAGATLYGLPLLDANYGIGDRIEVTYEAPWAVLRDGSGSRSGPGNSLAGAKWRFYDAGEQGWQASLYPQLTFLDPGSHGDRRGLADSETTLLLPAEVARDLGPVALNFDFGHVFSSKAGDDSWMGGVILGHELRKGWELDVETHVNADNRLDRAEWIINAGTRIDLSEHVTLMAALGRDLANQLGPKASLLSYLGFQFRL